MDIKICIIVAILLSFLKVLPYIYWSKSKMRFQDTVIFIGFIVHKSKSAASKDMFRHNHSEWIHYVSDSIVPQCIIILVFGLGEFYFNITNILQILIKLPVFFCLMILTAAFTEEGLCKLQIGYFSKDFSLPNSLLTFSINFNFDLSALLKALS